MSWLEERIKLLNTYPADFTEAINASRIDLFAKLAELLTLLQTEGGSIVPSAENLILVDEILTQLGDSLFEPESKYLLALNSYLSGIAVGATQANAAMNIANADKFQGVLRALIINTQQLFDKTAVSALTTTNLRSVISGNVMAQSTTIEAIQSIKDLILGNDQREFFLTRYAKTWSLTGFASAESQYVKLVADDIGIERWEYAGRDVDDSRPFCLERRGKFFTREEIEAWPETAGQWQGRAYGTDSETIWAYRGGYNCGDVLMPAL